MLQLKNTNRGYGDETAISAYDIQVTETVGSLYTLSFTFVENENNQVGGAMMIPRTVITDPVTKQQYRISSADPVPNNRYRVWSVSAIQVGNDLGGHYVEAKLQKTQSLKACMNLITTGTRFNYVIHGNFKNYSFSEGFGTGMANDLLNQLASDFKFEFYFDNYTIHIKQSIGKTDAFLFVDNANVSKIAQKENYDAIKTHIKGYAGKPNEKTGKYPIEAEYTSPLANREDTKWGIIDAEPYSNENMKKDALLASLKEQLHDYPDVEYTVDSVSFNKTVGGFVNDTAAGNSGFLRDRYGIDITVRIQSRSFYPQEPKRVGSITFGNVIFSNDLLENRTRQAYKQNIKLGQTLKKDVRNAADRALDAWNSRLVAQQLNDVGLFSRKISVQDDELEETPTYALTLPEDNPLDLPEGTQLNFETDAKAVRGLSQAIQSGQAGVVTPETNGLMIAADKEKLDQLEKYEDATLTKHGLMSIADKQKLEELEVEPFESIQIKDSKTGSIFLLTVENGEIKLTEAI